MWRLLVFAAVLQCSSSYSSCPNGYELVRNGECRGHEISVKITLDQGVNTMVGACSGVRGQPVIIKNDEHQDYWKALAPDNADGFLLLGIVCDSKKNRYMWADGTSIDYRPASAGWTEELDTNSCSSGYSFMIYPTGYWNYGGRGSAVQAEIYCTTQLAPPPPGADGCESFADDADDGVCYQVGAVAETRQDAQDTCAKLGAKMASIHNAQENNFVRQLAASKGSVNGIYIGATARVDGTIGWMDGTDMDYTNYYPGFPKKNFGNCIAMDTSTTAGQWMNVDCETKLPVACVRPQGSTDGPVCDGEDYGEGALIVSPGFPNTAAVECDWFLTADAGKKVQLEIILLEANSCCDSLILYDGYLGGAIIETLSGSIQNATYTTKTSNIMRVSWQPNGGVNVRGVAMTFRAV